MDLKAQVLEERRALYVKLRGGYTFPLAGALWWAGAAALGYYFPLEQWTLYIFMGSGLIFPLAMLLSRLFNVNFMGEKSAVDTVMGAALVGMLLFWPMAFAAYGRAPEMAPLIVAIGMSLHWPVVGWSYGRTALYAAHAIVRAIAVLAIWTFYPEQITTWLPASVAVVYAITVLAILIDVQLVGASRRRLALA
jgi:hypothetical protein